ncbi:hypothetical protein Tco_0522004 [Tanacetum coccineum]
MGCHGRIALSIYTNHKELLPCFELIQLHELLEEDTEYRLKDESEPSDQKLMNHTECELNLYTQIQCECKAVYTNKGKQIETSFNKTNEVQGVSFVEENDIRNKEKDISEALPCQPPPKELNPGNTVDSSNDMQGPKVEHKDGENLEKITSRWHVCKPVRVFYDNECGKDCGMWHTCNLDLRFCSGYDAIYGKDENGMLKQWMCFQDHERQSIRGNRNKYDLRIGKKGFALDDAWEKCEKINGGTVYPWHDKGFEEEER